jgi:clan AA aspartic protease
MPSVVADAAIGVRQTAIRDHLQSDWVAFMASSLSCRAADRPSRCVRTQSVRARTHGIRARTHDVRALRIPTSACADNALLRFDGVGLGWYTAGQAVSAPIMRGKAVEGSMGLTYISMNLSSPARPEHRIRRRFLVDSGATYTVVPADMLTRLGIKPHSKRTFVVADGTERERRFADALFEYRGNKGASPVIFGEPGDATLMGTVTLESLGLLLDPVRRELRPLPMLI